LVRRQQRRTLQVGMAAQRTDVDAAIVVAPQVVESRDVLMSTSNPGDAKRSFSIGTRLWPPARTLASPSPARSSSIASSSVPGAS